MKVNLGLYEGYWVQAQPNGNLICLADESMRPEAKFGYNLIVNIRPTLDTEPLLHEMCCVILEKTDDAEKRVIAGPVYNSPIMWNSFQFFFRTYDEVLSFCNKSYTIVDLTSYLGYHQHVTKIEEDGTVYIRFCQGCRLRSVVHLPRLEIISPVGDKEKCAVCLDGMRAGTRNTIQLSCGHVFHLGCLPPSQWYEYFYLPDIKVTRIIACPMCRYKQPVATKSFPPFPEPSEDDVVFVVEE